MVDQLDNPPRINFLTQTEIIDAWQERRWQRGAGGNLYFTGRRDIEHPHLHLIVRNAITERVGGQDISRSLVRRTDGFHVGANEIRLSVLMLALGDRTPQGHQNGFTYIRNGELTPNWNNGPALSEAMQTEANWILNYYTTP